MRMKKKVKVSMKLKRRKSKQEEKIKESMKLKQRRMSKCPGGAMTIKWSIMSQKEVQILDQYHKKYKIG